jgi:hypothetical protein
VLFSSFVISTSMRRLVSRQTMTAIALKPLIV